MKTETLRNFPMPSLVEVNKYPPRHMVWGDYTPFKWYERPCSAIAGFSIVYGTERFWMTRKGAEVRTYKEFVRVQPEFPDFDEIPF